MPPIHHRVTAWSLAATAGALVLAGVVSLALLSSRAAAGAAAGHLRTAVTASTRISLRATKVGRILVGPNGHTLYAFTRDSRNRDRCATIRGCTGVWPLVTSSGRPAAGSGVKGSLLSTIRVGRASQVTYAGHPLYTYSADSSAGQTSYVGVSQFGGRWPAVSDTGALVK